MRTLILLTLGVAVAAVACYDPNIQDGAFKCAESEAFACPTGLTCDKASGLCVNKLSTDLGTGDALPQFDFAGVTPRSCDDRVQEGAFSAMVNLGTVNTSGAEHSLTLSSDGTQLYWLDDGNALTTATLGPDKKSVGAASAVTLSGFVGSLNGGSIAADGSYWFAGTVSGTTSLFQGTRTSATVFNVGLAHQPSTPCLFGDPVFTNGNAKGELYVTSPLPACPADPTQAFIAQGAADKLIGGFYGAFPDRGFRFPSVVAGGTTLLFSSMDGVLYYASRASTDVQWSSPVPLPMGAIGAAKDCQAVVAPACDVIYFVSERAGGKGGADLWAATIAAQ